MLAKVKLKFKFEIETEMNKLDLIDVLVNNVGTIRRMEYFTEIPAAINKTYFNVNMLSYTKMIEIILPKMVLQKRGIIINISSSAGEKPMPLMTTYAASEYNFNIFITSSFLILILKESIFQLKSKS